MRREPPRRAADGGLRGSHVASCTGTITPTSERGFNAPSALWATVIDSLSSAVVWSTWARKSCVSSPLCGCNERIGVRSGPWRRSTQAGSEAPQLSYIAQRRAAGVRAAPLRAADTHLWPRERGAPISTRHGPWLPRVRRSPEGDGLDAWSTAASERGSSVVGGTLSFGLWAGRATRVDGASCSRALEQLAPLLRAARTPLMKRSRRGPERTTRPDQARASFDLRYSRPPRPA